MAGARLGELAYSRRNLEASGGGSAGKWSTRTYPILVVVHAVAILATLYKGKDRASKVPLVLLLAVQPLRAWMFFSLRSRWNARGVVAEDMEIETGGMYRWVRHPNYAIIFVELACLPLTFGLRCTAAAVTVANAAVLAVRIREEEADLFKLPGYREHFGRKKRFIPWVF